MYVNQIIFYVAPKAPFLFDKLSFYNGFLIVVRVLELVDVVRVNKNGVGIRIENRI